MVRQEIVWTIVPKTLDEKTNRLSFTVLVSPKLYSGQNISEMLPLAQFPDFENWIENLALQLGNDRAESKISFKLVVNDKECDVALLVSHLRYASWKRIFKDIRVKAYENHEKDFQAAERRRLLINPSSQAHEALRDTYGEVARASLLKKDSSKYVKSLLKRIRPQDLGETIRKMRQPDRLIPLIADDGDLHKCFARIALFFAPPAAPESVERTVDDTKEFDFHQAVAGLGEYPDVLRHLGLQLECECTIPPEVLGNNYSLRIKNIKIQLKTETQHILPRTMCEVLKLRNETLVMPSESASSKIPTINGLVKLAQKDGDQSEFSIQQIDSTGSSLKVLGSITNQAISESLPHEIKTCHNSAEASEKSPPGSLPALRNAGIEIIHAKRGSQLTSAIENASKMTAFIKTQARNLTFSTNNQVEIVGMDLYAQDLTCGFRLDIRNDNTWRSTCSRYVECFFRDDKLDEIFRKINDEGWTSSCTTTRNDSYMSNTGIQKLDAMYGHETIARWEGWSAVAPRPDTPLSEPGQPMHDHLQKLLRVNVAATLESLAALRLGNCYDVRLRLVWPNGGGLTVSQADEIMENKGLFEKLILSDIYRRFEPINPPIVAFRRDTVESESIDRLVLRNFDSECTTEESERHLLAPKTSIEMALLHGRLDKNGRPDADAYDLIVEKDKELDGTVFRDDSIEVPYFPDPLSHGIKIELFDDLNGSFIGSIEKKYHGKWPELRSIGLKVISTLDSRPSCKLDGNHLVVALPKGFATTAKIRSLIPDELREHGNLQRLMGLFNWALAARKTNEPLNADDLKILRAAAHENTNWMLVPERVMSLVHAVQKPLCIPKISSLKAERMIEETFATLTGTIEFCSRSTGKIELEAEWIDVIDDGVSDSIVEAPLKPHVSTLTVASSSEIPFLVKHEFGDTKYRKICVSSKGVSKFSECYPKEVRDKTENMLSSASKRIDLTILNSCPPPPPRIQYIIPTFERKSDGRSASRLGAARVYIDRPWEVSGQGELLALAFFNGRFSEIEQRCKWMQRRLTQWGMDPLFAAPPVSDQDFSSAESLKTAFPDSAEVRLNVPLPKLANDSDSINVNIVGFSPQFDKMRKMWFCDIEFPLQSSYFPFIQMGFVRFQPNSLQLCHISQLQSAYFAQIASQRHVSMIANGDNLHVTVHGPGFSQTAGDRAKARTSSVVIRLEEAERHRSRKIWRPVSSSVELELARKEVERVVTYDGDIQVKKSPDSVYRLLVKEFEIFGSPGLSGSAGVLQKRLVFAETLVF